MFQIMQQISVSTGAPSIEMECLNGTYFHITS